MNLTRGRSLAGLTAVAVALVAACEGKTTKPTPEQPAIAIAVAASSLDVTAGTNGTLGVSLTRSGGFTGPVTLSAAGAPSGVTISPITLATGETSGSLTVATTAAAAVGSSTITVSASGTGVTTRTATFTLNVKAPPGFALTLGATTLALQAGTNGTATINLARSGGFTGPISLAVTGAPAGLTATLDSTSVGGTGTTLRLAANSTLAAGAYTLTITGTGAGVPNQSATLTVNVTAAPPPGGFTLTLAPATVSVQAGASVADTVKIARTGTFAGAVGLSVTGAPNGMTVTLDSASVGGARTILRIATTTAVAVANYTLTVAGTAAGVTNQTGTLQVTVTAPSTGGNVSYTFCGDQPIWVAVQDGAGAWTRVTSTTSTYSFNIGTKGGLAYVTGDATNGYDLQVYYATAQEFQAQGAGTVGCTPTTGGKTVNGSVASLGLTDEALVNLGGSSAFVLGATGGTFTLQNVPDGLVDLVAAKLSLSGESLTLNRLYLQRGLNPANNSTLPPIDFSGALAFDPVNATVTIANLGTDTAFVNAFLHTANGGLLPYSFGGVGTTSTAVTFAAIPASKLIAGDVQMVMVSAMASSTATSSRLAGAFFTDPANQTVTLGPALSGAAASVLGTTPYVRLRVSYTPQTEYNTFWTADFTQGTGATHRSAQVAMTTAYRAATGALTLDIPDFSGVSGWSNSWGLQAGASTRWTLSAYGWSGTGSITMPFVAGTFFQEAYVEGTITP